MSTFSANPTIEALLASAGAHEALERQVLGLFDLLRSRLLRYTGSLGLSPEDGEDVVQETFLALFRHLAAGRSQENIHGWVFRVTHNLTLKRRMRSSREVATEMAEPIDRDLDPEQWMLLGERRIRLRATMDALSQTDRSCLLLRAEGLRYREIAGVLGISLGSVSASLARSVKRLECVDRR